MTNVVETSDMTGSPWLRLGRSTAILADLCSPRHSTVFLAARACPFVQRLATRGVVGPLLARIQNENTASDPLFANAAGGDLRLRTVSPAVGGRLVRRLSD